MAFLIRFIIRAGEEGRRQKNGLTRIRTGSQDPDPRTGISAYREARERGGGGGSERELVRFVREARLKYIMSVTPQQTSAISVYGGNEKRGARETSPEHTHTHQQGKGDAASALRMTPRPRAGQSGHFFARSLF